MKYTEKLRNSGLRPTKQRLQICEVLFNRDKTFHFTINELEQRIKKHTDNKISLATIYNTIQSNLCRVYNLLTMLLWIVWLLY